MTGASWPEGSVHWKLPWTAQAVVRDAVPIAETFARARRADAVVQTDGDYGVAVNMVSLDLP